MEPIDMVYLWCDGSDKRFAMDKEKYLAKETAEMDEEATGDLRFFDNEELKYSLRSLEKNATWVNHVFIVTDRQCPKWLNIDYEKVTVIDHSQILPQEDIPTFTSLAIEYRMHLIPGLSEKFLYANDDMFFGREVRPEFFFCDDKPIVRVVPYPPIRKIASSSQLEKACVRESMWINTNLNAWKILSKEYEKQNFYLPHHNIDSYKKSDFEYVLKKNAEILKPTLHNRFRSEKNIARALLTLDAAYRGTSILKVLKRLSFRQKHLWWGKKDFCESYTGSENTKTVKRIKKIRPCLFCLNADKNSDVMVKIKMRNFMQEMFPIPSKFEKI